MQATGEIILQEIKSHKKKKKEKNTHVCSLQWLREQTDDNDGDNSDPEKNQRKIHVMNLGDDRWASVLFTTWRRKVGKVKDHTNRTNDKTHYHAPKSTLCK